MYYLALQDYSFEYIYTGMIGIFLLLEVEISLVEVVVSVEDFDIVFILVEFSLVVDTYVAYSVIGA